MAVISTGSITIVDQNDAKPLTAFISGSGPLQQLAEVSEGLTTYVPDWTATPLVLTASVYAGSVTNIASTSAARNKKWWSSAVGSQGSPISTNSHILTLNTNIDVNVNPTVTYYFSCDVYDSVTQLTTPVVCSTTISGNLKGTNAVWLVTRGNTNLSPAPSGTKNCTSIAATLFRAGNADESGITYKWYAANGTELIDATTSNVSTLYGFATTAAWPAMPTASNGSLGLSIPADGAWTTRNTLVIHEDAVPNLSIFRVDAKDGSGNIYSTSFIITDVDDPYTSTVVSSAGDKLINGTGSTDVYVLLYKKGVRITDLRNFTFTYYAYNRSGNRTAFVDVGSTAKVPAVGVDVVSNTTGTTASITVATNITLVAGDVVKLYLDDGSERLYEVGTAVTAGKTFSIRPPVTNTFLTSLNTQTISTANVFAGSKLFLCKTSYSKVGGNGNQMANAITVTGDDIDSKMMVLVEVEKTG